MEEAGAAVAAVAAPAEEEAAEVQVAQEAQQAALPAALWLSWVREPVSAQEQGSGLGPEPERARVMASAQD